jgi:hypothetical protein
MKRTPIDKQKALTRRVNRRLNEELKAGMFEEYQRKYDALSVREKELMRRALHEPWDESTGKDFEEILAKFMARH